MQRAADPDALKRVGPGSYRTPDGRFTVEQASGRWLVLDAEQADDLGLPLTRGPFATLDAAKASIADARVGPAPESALPDRIARLTRGGTSGRPRPARKADAQRRSGRAEATRATRGAPKPRPPELRRYRPGEGAALREFWATVGFGSLGDDDDALDRLAERNPGLVLVAASGDRIVGTALGAWDGRRGWIYHVAVAPDARRSGLGRRLVHEVERRLRALGCPKVNVIVRDDNPDAVRFWEALGYASPPARQFGREL